MELKKKMLLPLLAAMLLAVAGGISEASEASGPSAFLPEKVYTFAPVLEGTQVVHNFVLRNTGDAPLIIERLVSG